MNLSSQKTEYSDDAFGICCSSTLYKCFLMLEGPGEFWLLKQSKPTNIHLPTSSASTSNNPQGADNLESHWIHSNIFYYKKGNSVLFLSSEQSVSAAFVVIGWNSTQNFHPIPIFFLELLLALTEICDQIQAKHSDTNPSYWRLPE